MIFEDVVKNLSGSVVGHPALSEEIIHLQKSLMENDLPELPQSFIAFLKSLNGFMGNGIEFYGIKEIEDKASHYTLPPLLEKNTKTSKNKDFLILGSVDDLTFVFNPKDNLFASMELPFLEPEATYTSFEELFKDVLCSYYGENL
ncbi:MAG: hypothetical protein EOM53_03550 [Alphaproteobacteria bacterium]|nr:hypothetical protein [Alphaproteobacteria bacterium]